MSYHANVKDPEFSIDFFKQFNVVLNGLDNLDARRHVNRICLAANVPLVESGTTGFLGQVICHSMLYFVPAFLLCINLLFVMCSLCGFAFVVSGCNLQILILVWFR